MFLFYFISFSLSSLAWLTQHRRPILYHFLCSFNVLIYPFSVNYYFRIHYVYTHFVRSINVVSFSAQIHDGNAPPTNVGRSQMNGVNYSLKSYGHIQQLIYILFWCPSRCFQQNRLELECLFASYFVVCHNFPFICIASAPKTIFGAVSFSERIQSTEYLENSFVPVMMASTCQFDTIIFDTTNMTDTRTR